jgi:prepilin-type N-terminal cleavage/methylation domain-containing protein
VLRTGTQSRRGFTLIELVIVIAIILILLVVLLFFIMAAVSKGKEGTTRDLFSQIETSLAAWRQGEGMPGQAFPRSGTNTNQFPKDLEQLNNMLRQGQDVTAVYAGNRALFRALVSDPKAKGREPYVKVTDSLVGYLDTRGGVMPVGDVKDAVFLDGWGKPIIYWEWATMSQAASSAGSEDIPGSRSASSTVVVPSWAKNRGSYDIYSAGGDQIWNNENDLSNVTGGAETPVSGIDPIGTVPAASRSKKK